MPAIPTTQYVTSKAAHMRGIRLRKMKPRLKNLSLAFSISDFLFINLSVNYVHVILFYLKPNRSQKIRKQELA